MDVAATFITILYHLPPFPAILHYLFLSFLPLNLPLFTPTFSTLSLAESTTPP